MDDNGEGWSAPWVDELLEQEDSNFPSASVEPWDSIPDSDVQLQLAIYLSTQDSLQNSRTTKPQDDHDHDAEKTLEKGKGICISHPLDHDELNTWTSSKKREERGEHSWSQCVICGVEKPTGAMKQAMHCGHFFCEDCIRVYLGKKIQENIHNVKCPHKKCPQLLDIYHCRSFIPEEVYHRWNDALSESRALANLAPDQFQSEIQADAEAARELYGLQFPDDLDLDYNFM